MPEKKTPLSVVVIEDVHADFLLIDNELKKAGMLYRLKRVETREELTRELRDMPDVILSDHGLPQFDGFTALKLAKQICPDVPFIFVTGSIGEESAVKALKDGATDFILKDHIRKLGPAVERALRQADEHRRRQAAERALRHSESRHRAAEAEVRRLNVELEQRVIERTAQLESANRDLESFSYSVSHDLRAPLRHIQGFAEILSQHCREKLDAEDRQLLDYINRAVTRMGRLIDDLLAFARLGLAEVRKTRSSLDAIVQGAMNDLEPKARTAALWTIDELPDVDADPVLLRQVLANLISNALKYSRPRKPPNIEIGAVRTPQEVVVHVKDNGVGFDMQYSEKLFKVFQRLHRESDFEGLGIGLANVRRIVERHGGKTWAEGAPDAGATFYFSLPVSNPEQGLP